MTKSSVNQGVGVHPKIQSFGIVNQNMAQIFTFHFCGKIIILQTYCTDVITTEQSFS